MRRIILFIAISALGLSVGLVHAQKKDQVKSLDATIRQMELSVREMSDAELKLAIRKHEELLNKYASDEFSPKVLFQLSELHIRKSKMNFEKAMQKYELEYQKYKNNEIGIEPKVPKVDFDDAVFYLNEILNNYSNIGMIDKVLYRLSLCYKEEGNVSKSIECLKRLIASTPQSNFVPEAYFRLGEHLFDQGEFEKSVYYYQKLVSKDMWSTQFFDMSLYKLGWANYKLSHYPKAVSYFVMLLKDIDVLQRVKTQQLDRTAADLKHEALTYIAVCFSEYGEVDQASEFLNELSKDVYKRKILEKLGDIYLKQDRVDQAIQTFENLLNAFPTNSTAPNWAHKIVNAYENKWDLAGANEVRGRLVEDYNMESEWYKAQSDSAVKEKALKMVKTALHKKGVYHQIQAREGDKDRAEYQKAIKQYRTYLNYFPDDSIAYKVNYFLAECYYAIDQFEKAAKEYKNVYSKYPKKDYYEDAIYNSVLSYYKASRQYKTTAPQKFTLNGFFGLAGSVAIEVGNPATQQFILACNEFIELMPRSPRVVDILMKEAEVLNELNRYDLSRRVYLKVVKDYPHSPQFAKAASMIAQSYFKEEDFAQAEKWYKTVVTMLPDTMEVVDKAKVMMASSHYKMAQKFKETGELRKAANEFASAAINYPSSQIAKLSLIEAGKTLESLGDTTKAALIYEQFMNRYTDSDLMEMCVLKAAKYRENIGDWQKAAEDYLKLRFSNSANRSGAIFKAGLCYFNAQNWEKASEILDEYVQISDNPNHTLEALCRIGLCWYNQEENKKAKAAFQKTISTYHTLKASNPLNTYYVAQAQFQLGEIEYHHFASVELVPPFQENLERKKGALQSVLEQYTKATRFKVGEWTTASLYKIGKVLEEFGNAFLHSPLPEDLTEEEVVAYEMNLKKYAAQFHRKAMERYHANVKLAEKNNIRNSWITLSKSHISMLSSLLENSEEAKK